MSFGITKTIPIKNDQDFVDSLYDGRLSEFEFHMAGSPSKLNVGDFVYTIYRDQLVGRLVIDRFIEGATNPNSGKPRTLIMVRCPGERRASPLDKKGHRGTRYWDGEGY
jgi:hypothetical protein